MAATATLPGAERSGAASAPCSTISSPGVSVSRCSPLVPPPRSFLRPDVGAESGTVTVVLGGGGALIASTMTAPPGLLDVVVDLEHRHVHRDDDEADDGPDQ